MMEQYIIACLKVAGRSGRYIYPGSVKVSCMDCEEPIWLAPSGQDLMKEKDAIPVCMDCAHQRVIKEPGEIIITEKTRLEVQAWMLRH